MDEETLRKLEERGLPPIIINVPGGNGENGNKWFKFLMGIVALTLGGLGVVVMEFKSDILHEFRAHKSELQQELKSQTSTFNRKTEILCDEIKTNGKQIQQNTTLLELYGKEHEELRKNGFNKRR